MKKFLKEEMRWSLRQATRPGKKTPENIEQVLTDAALCLTSTISEFGVLKFLIVNSDQTGVLYLSRTGIFHVLFTFILLR